MKSGYPILPPSNVAQTSSKGEEPMVTASAIPTSSVSTQSMFQLSVEHIQQIISVMSNTTMHSSIP